MHCDTWMNRGSLEVSHLTCYNWVLNQLLQSFVRCVIRKHIRNLLKEGNKITVIVHQKLLADWNQTLSGKYTDFVGSLSQARFVNNSAEFKRDTKFCSTQTHNYFSSMWVCQLQVHEVKVKCQNLQTSCNLGKSPCIQALSWLWLFSTIFLLDLFPSILYIKCSGESSNSGDSDLGRVLLKNREEFMCQRNSRHTIETSNHAEVAICHLETGQSYPRDKTRERNTFWSWKHTWAESHVMDMALSRVSRVLSSLIRHFTVPICHGRSKASDLLRMKFPQKIDLTPLWDKNHQRTRIPD